MDFVMEFVAADVRRLFSSFMCKFAVWFEKLEPPYVGRYEEF